MPKWADAELRVNLELITHDDIVYLAGLFDGEGCVSVNEGRRAHLVIGMTDRTSIEWICERFAGAYYDEERPNEKHSKLYRWTVSRRADVEWIVQAILPYTICKRERLEAVLRLIEHAKLRPGLHGVELDVWNEKLPSVVAPIRAGYWRDTEQPSVAKTL